VTRAIRVGSVAVAGLLMAGCATSLRSKASEVESLKTQVASLETQVGQLNAQVEELSKKQATVEEQPAAPAPAVKENRLAKGPNAALSPRQVQLALKSAGFYAGPIDGKLGHQTKEAVRAFQRSNGLTPDGKVGTKTSIALAKFLEKENGK